ncbi:unnamed protein product [Adineta steineri]|uniref:Uncharacterized protein n=1 Tax=Adineta steineri TaxID=433720 RepID=A0A815DXU7_9BILA|nr:unnamed protein product [Adineta steineri]CAF1183900.1 unnamed protein product [Adineta steineri]CAF1303651.1 unnamed protein product [Adineta steineri]CAF1576722.1 unnamed protein product [Adineta steineri]
MFWLLIPNGFNTQDMAKLSGKQFCNNYSSTLIKAHGPAAIFLISSNKQNLCQLNYHHKENNPSICIKHDEILIDPLLFYIKYKKLIQYPNEVFILSSGILSQSFTQDNNQCESSNYEQILNMIDTPLPPSNHQSINEQIYLKNKKLSKILYVLNLNKKIRKNYFKNYFIGSTKILLERRQLPAYLNYVFIFHRTNLQVEYNRKRANSSSHFGSNCHIEFVRNLSKLSTENNIKNLFFHSDKIKCIPPRIVQKSRVWVYHIDDNHIHTYYQDILAGKINDITNGANNSYSPRSMSSEAQKIRCKKSIGTGRMDCNGGLEKSEL